MASPGKQYGAEIYLFVDFISQDDRPTFLCDIDTRQILFRNHAFNAHILEHANDSSLQAWVDSSALDTSTSLAGVTHLGAFANEEWQRKSLGKESLVVIFCSRNSQLRQQRDVDDTKPTQEEGQELHNMSLGWLQPSDEPWMAFVRDYAFEDTAIGPIPTWSPRLRQTVQTMMTCPEPRILYWGNDLNIIYNEAAVPVIGEKHPSCLGNPLKQEWSLAYDQIVQSIKAVMQQGKAFQAKNVKFILERNGFPEETWHHFHQLPITSSGGYFLGCLCEFAEVTSAFVQHNRSTVIDGSIKAASEAKTLPQLFSNIMSIIERESLDVAYGLIYSIAKDSSAPSGYSKLEASYGVSDIAIGTTASPALAEAFRSQMVILRGETLPAELSLSLPDQGTVSSVAIFPITDLNKFPLAYVVLGLNPRRPFDDAARSFVHSLGDLFVKSATFMFIPEEQRRNQEITLQLEVALLKAEKNKETIARMARDAPIGMYTLKPDGSPTFVNDAYLELIGMNRAEFFENSEAGINWMGFVIEEDQELVASAWSLAIQEKRGAQLQIRVKSPTTDSGVRWLESTSFAECDKSGNLISVQGWLVDVSSRKLTEKLMAERLEDALETKRASESFMDMVSHEIRNPLSSITQLTDSIMTVLDPPEKDGPPTLSTEGFESMTDSAQTIAMCASHMRNIIDEILTYSKLDSNLLVLSLEPLQAPTVINTALKMFEMELGHSKIKVSTQIHQSYTDLAVDYVLIDPSRFIQIIINLLTNAIKFTRDSATRHITISVAASGSEPSKEEFGIEFLSRQKNDGTRKNDNGSSPLSSPQLRDWNAGKEVYLYVGIEDTGRGLTVDETKVLFQRFAQASPKTYKSYGGSGLGLFISKKLTELQGGQIGVKSESGIGSTFGFYIKVKRTEPPKEKALNTGVNAAEALTKVASLPHKEGFPDVKIITHSSSCEASSISAKDLHVLVVEDNAINKKVIVQQLRRLGVGNVHSAENGLEALDFLSTTALTRPFDPESVPLSLILLDIEMPVMDGLTCIKTIRQMEATGNISRHIPVIAITANARSEQIATALEAGMDEVVTKPFRIPELIPRMEALVQKHLPRG